MDVIDATEGRFLSLENAHTDKKTTFKLIKMYVLCSVQEKVF